MAQEPLTADVTALDTSAAPSAVESSTTADNSEKRINDLMSNWQKEQAKLATEQAEAQRLREQLATAVAARTELTTQIEELRKQDADKKPEQEQAFAELQRQLDEARQEKQRLALENTRLSFLRQNPDLMAYAEVLPVTDDVKALEAIAASIRTARDTETARLRGQLTTPSTGSSVPRRPVAASTPAEIEAYLNSAKSQAEYEARLREFA